MSNKRTILVVDDQPKNLQLAAYVLKPYYELILVSNAQKALQMAKDRRPDLILLDIMMPVMSGYEVCEAMKADPLIADIPVIFLTAKVSEEDLIKGYDVGGVDYVTKPFRAKELLLRIGTQIKLVESVQKINRYNDYLKILNDNKDKIFSAIAHDLKGTSGQIYSLIDIILNKLQATLGDDALEKPLTMLKESSSRNLNLVNDLFSWSKNQFEEVAPQVESINLPELVKKMIEQQSDTISKKGIKVVRHFDTRSKIFSDRGSIEFVGRNVLSNAVKFVNEGGEIRISHFSEDIYDVVEVRDNGIGMSAAQLEALVKGSTLKSQRGTSGERGNGLGFKLCQDFMQKAGGFIKVDSVQGHGTTVQIWVPRLAPTHSKEVHSSGQAMF